MSHLNGVSDEAFNLWKHHPVTQLFRQYVADFSEALVKTHLDEWHAGKIDQVRDLEIRGRVAQLIDILALSFNDIRSFYPEQEGTDATPPA